jgi:hypothetical protein
VPAGPHALSDADFRANPHAARFKLFRSRCFVGSRALHSAGAHTGLDALPQVGFTQLSAADPSPLGAKALALHPEEWKHAETAHFIYHFQQSFVATAVSVEAEFYFRVILKELEQPESAMREKAHIYIFERPEDWSAFQSAGQLEPWTGGIQSGGSLFIVRNPAFRFTDNSLGHEIVHLLLRRLYAPMIPLWLNEGLAQYLSKNAHASFQHARGFVAKPWSSAVAPDKFIPLTSLTTMGYPSGDSVAAFYDESERLVRFLMAADRVKFLELLRLSVRGVRFDDTIARVYGSTFRSAANLEQRFRTYAVSPDAIPVVER